MRKTKYHIYLEILGFKKLTKEIAKKSGFYEDVIIQKFISNPLQKELEAIKRKGFPVFMGKSEIEGSDNFILIVDDVETAFEILQKITRIKIPHKDYMFIPLEIGLDMQKIDESIQVDSINRKEIIDFLKNDIINPYHNYYKEELGGEIKETAVLLTQRVFDNLDPLDKKYCRRILYKKKTFSVADLEKIQQRYKVLKFLDKIERKHNKLYSRIDDLYVTPLEYDEVKATLNKDKIVFITGSVECGKRYTAVRFLWEYYQNYGYEPVWIKRGEEKQRTTVRERLEEIKRELIPHHIICFENPFRKTKYKKRESLKREIEAIIELVREINDVFVIITSGEEVFKEFEEGNLSAYDLKEFEKKLNIKKPSYDYERRKELLLKWAKEENCKWVKDDDLKKIVLKSLEYKKNLPTPLSITDFAIATRNITIKDELKEKIKEKSKKTVKAFAEEIKNMTDDKILFLLFPFICSYFTTDVVQAEYEELVEELKIKKAWKFNRVLNWFKDNKIVAGENIAFSHPSYYEAFKYLFFKDIYITRIKEIFSKLLTKLSYKGEFVEVVAGAVAANFDKLPEDVRKLLFGLSDKGDRAVALAIEDNFDELPENVRNKLLFKLSKKDKAVESVIWTITDNFDKLPEDIRNLLFEVSNKDARAVALAITDNFDKLPEGVRNKLLLKLSEMGEAAETVALILADNFYEFHRDLRNKLLFKLSEKEEAAGAIAWAIAANFDKLPEDVRKLLFELSDKEEAVETIVLAIIDNFDKLPEDVRNLLFKLFEKEQAAEPVALAITDNFDKLPEDVRNLLFKLSEKEETASAVAWAIEVNFDKLPENIRKLLDRLQKPFKKGKNMSKDFEAYLKLDKTGLANKYVVIVNGKLVDKGEDIEKMLEKVKKQYPNKIPFVAKVPDERMLIL